MRRKTGSYKDINSLDTAKFHGFINGDGDFLVMYEGVIDNAVMGAVLAAEDGTSVTLSGRYYCQKS